MAAAPGRSRTRPPSACGAPSVGGRPVVVKRLAAPAVPGGASPALASGAAPPTSPSRGWSTTTPGLRAPADRGGGGRRRDHPGLGVGRARAGQRACSWRPAWAGSRPPTSAARPGWPTTSSATGSGGSSERAAGRPWRGPRWRTWPTTCGGTARSAWPPSTPCPLVAQHGDPTGPNLLGRLADDVVAIDWDNLGRGPVGGDLGYYALSAREEFEPLLAAYARRPGPELPRPTSRWPWAPASPPSTPP